MALPDELSLDEQAAQLLFPRLGSNMPPPVTVAEDAERVERLLERCPVGGLILFNGSLEETPATLRALQRRARVPLLVASDIERGAGQQIRGATVFPHAMAFAAAERRLGASEAAERLREAARVQAREALACGLHVTFAPVADVNRNPRNPIIATRAFGTEPEGAARFVRAYIQGCRDAGLLTTAKHFPGHGDTHQDSHAELPRVDDDRAVLERTDLLPFRAAIEEGVDLIMTAHVVYPALDGAERPATASPPILRELLRDELRFRGAVVTDSLLMGAIRDAHAGPEAQAVALVEAGVDILLDVAEPERARDGLVEAVASGRLDRTRLEEACRRVLALKQRLSERFGPDFFADPERYVPTGYVGSEEHLRLAEAVAREALFVDGIEEALPAMAEGGSGLLVLYVQPHRTRLDPPEAPLGEAVRRAFPGARYVEVRPEADGEQLRRLAEEARTFRHVVVAAVVKPAAWHAFGLLPAQADFVRTLARERPIVLASLGSPIVLEAYPEAALRICTYSDVPASQRALVAALTGQVR